MTVSYLILQVRLIGKVMQVNIIYTYAQTTHSTEEESDNFFYKHFNMTLAQCIKLNSQQKFKDISM